MKKVILIYIIGALMFVLSFSMFVFGHSLLTSSFQQADPLQMSRSANYLEGSYNGDYNMDSPHHLIFEHDTLDDNEYSINIEGAELSLYHSNSLLYPSLPQAGQQLGTLKIDALSIDIPVYYDTAADEFITHDKNSVLPGEAEHSVLMGDGHSVLEKLSELKKGEKIVVQTPSGTFTYAVDRMYAVHDENTTISEYTGEASLSLAAIYDNPGHNSLQKYVVYSVLVDYYLSS
ncbi:sortase domain-bontaining protein [Bacillus horti]|uniref:LPXTG-site transpeptidase (Sortase) family protein n=1 Tax=Caldalkalibacillus horti TaxID=77523 RepID=A0ABT9W423_9BACI|nr:sortase [Bacillus horti]MDQ0167994.1 LPXTG-site transpeptidase (sortase) family protein [Bacillus horti]